MIHGLPQGFTVAFLSLFPVMNPVGALAPFVALTEGDPARARNRQALMTGVWAFALLALFAVAGRPLLHVLGISLPALQLAGGLVVAAAGYGMVRSSPRLTSAEQDHSQSKDDVSFSPMAMPLVAGPGSLGIVIALTARSSGAPAIGGIVLGCLGMCLLVSVLLRLGTPVVDKLGPMGVGAIARIFGFLILAIGVELAVHGALALAPGLAR